MVPRGVQNSWKGRTRLQCHQRRRKAEGRKSGSMSGANELPKKLRPRSSLSEGKPQASLDLCPGWRETAVECCHPGAMDRSSLVSNKQEWRGEKENLFQLFRDCQTPLLCLSLHPFVREQRGG